MLDHQASHFSKLPGLQSLHPNMESIEAALALSARRYNLPGADIDITFSPGLCCVETTIFGHVAPKRRHSFICHRIVIFPPYPVRQLQDGPRSSTGIIRLH
jgi:hypothetical protein